MFTIVDYHAAEVECDTVVLIMIIITFNIILLIIGIILMIRI